MLGKKFLSILENVFPNIVNVYIIFPIKVKLLESKDILLKLME